MSQSDTSRVADIAGLGLPTWNDVKTRQYEAWDRDHIVIDTAHKSVVESLATLREELERVQRTPPDDMGV